MQDSDRTQDFVSTGFPPVTNKPSTACSGSSPQARRERQQGPAEHRAQLSRVPRLQRRDDEQHEGEQRPEQRAEPEQEEPQAALATTWEAAGAHFPNAETRFDVPALVERACAAAERIEIEPRA